MQRPADLFSVSIKGVLEWNGRFLLRRNQRGELELPGGRLEPGDASAEARLCTEFREESGIRVEVLAQREPWLYEVGERSIIIVPFLCRALAVPAVLADADGGTLHWLRPEELAAAPMPQGYRDAIRGAIPQRSRSAAPGAYFKIIPGYVEPRYAVEVRVAGDGRARMRRFLPRGCTPRELVAREWGEAYAGEKLVFEPMEIDRARNAIVLNYRIV